MHDESIIEVGVLATSACENLKGSPGLPVSPRAFLARLNALGWVHLQIVPTVAVYDMTFWDFCFWANDDDSDLISQIWRVIGKSIPENITDFSKMHHIADSEPNESAKFKKWRNVWCDVHSAHAHIKASRDVFITMNSKHFQANRGELALLGMDRIETPKSYLAH